MIITPKRPRNNTATSRISQLVPYMLKGKGGERCTWYMAGNLEGLERREDADLALSVMELIQEGNVRTKRDKTYHVVISFHPNDRQLADRELEDVVRRTVGAVGLQEHQYVAVRHSDQEHEHVHIAVNKIHPVTLKVHHPFRDIPLFKVLAGKLEKELGLYQVDRSVTRIDNDRSRDYESARGVQSFSRWARSHIGEKIDLDGVSNWNELHARLAVHGVRVVARGNGLAVVDATRGNLACKASSLGRHWSKQRLCERFGDFVPGPTAEHVATMSREAYRPEPLGPLRDDGLWREYEDALGAARTRRDERREALSSKIGTARAAHRRHFKSRHHAIAAMPIPGREKHKLYKMLSFERKAAERRLRASVKRWRTLNVHGHPGSWKAFLAARAARGDQRAIGRLTRQSRRLAIKSGDKDVRSLPSRSVRSSRGSIVHNLPGGVRLRESARTIELLGDARDEALEQLVRVAKQRFGTKHVTLLATSGTQKRLAELAVERGLEISQERER
ncbi:MAG: relaxase/mobilization nuclease domain-containing protein [Deltaproteobacteria bacterium]|nr:relaxase/mobilization nuclease domain-containing protein [Deltaproteobacteria bacterium]